MLRVLGFVIAAWIAVMPHSGFADPMPVIFSQVIDYERRFQPVTLTFDGTLLEERNTRRGQSSCRVGYRFDGETLDIGSVTRRGPDIRCPPSEMSFFFEGGTRTMNSSEFVSMVSANSWRTLSDTPTAAVFQGTLMSASGLLPDFLKDHYAATQIRFFVDKTVPYLHKVEIGFASPIQITGKRSAVLDFATEMRTAVSGPDRRPVIDRIAVTTNTVYADGRDPQTGFGSRMEEEISKIVTATAPGLAGRAGSGFVSAVGKGPLDEDCVSVLCRLKRKTSMAVEGVRAP